ncbi:DUF6461 domain-containing protein [Phytomonospora sp. NPDC050363]|uniref:DUF6461 domain-containing protein n=1 Tax=Phytomonospora sp. NPDC050363 TaxID=3155642 RepID=UPI00340ED87E
MSDATAADYRWLDEGDAGLVEAYCMTFLRGLAPRQVLTALETEPVETLTGAESLHDAVSEAYEIHDGDRLLVAVAELDGWTLMIEPNGYLGTFDEVMRPLSAAGGRVVSHFRNVNAADHFHLWDDGELRLHFEPLFPFHRDGPDADALAGELEAAGFDLSEDAGYDRHTEAAWALGERLTGVRVTARTLADTTFVCGLAPVPGR